MDFPYARIVPESEYDRAYDYAVPEELRAAVTPGMKVRVPLRRSETTGIVIESLQTSSFTRLRSILSVVGREPVVPAPLFALARWLADYYCAPLALALRCVLPEPVRKETAALTRLWVAPKEGVSEEDAVRVLGKAKRQLEAWRFFREGEGNWLAELIAAGFGRAVWQGLHDRGLAVIGLAARERDPLAELPIVAHPPHDLNAEQQAALAAVLEERAHPPEKRRPILLHGVTGSGKTEIYLRAIAQVLDAGQSALLIVPEIALTPQVIDRFRARFFGRPVGVAALHSRLSRGERRDQWERIRSGRAQIVIGARSAVFAPLENVGLIVVDEEHEHSFKQEEAPYYHGRDLAVLRGHLEGATVILGSATPSLESFHNAQQGKYRLLRLTVRPAARPMPTVHVVDLRQARREEKTEAPLLSPRLREAVASRLEKGEQTILYLNRRGHSTTLQCPECGHVENCSRCSVPMTYHRIDQRLRCHLCDAVSPVPSVCPQCRSPGYRYGGQGTQKVEEVVAKAFPQARLMRLDSDALRGKEAPYHALAAVARREVDILVGTQMIAKGLDFPGVTCVGVIGVDGALQIPDFRAGERVFHQLMQVAGRAGRGEAGGEVFIQTRTPFHPAIQFTRHHDYEGFAEQELEFRRQLNYPPFRRAILVRWRGRSEEKTRFVAEQVGKKILALVGAVTAVEGEAIAPAPVARVDDRFRFHLFLRVERAAAAARALRPLLEEPAWPDEVQMSIDVDPLNLG